MNSIAILLATVALGGDHGWETNNEGEVEYIIQIAPQDVDAVVASLRRGESIVHFVPEHLRNVRRIRIQIGKGALPKIPAQPKANGGTRYGVGDSTAGRYGNNATSVAGDGRAVGSRYSAPSGNNALTQPRIPTGVGQRNLTRDGRDITPPPLHGSDPNRRLAGDRTGSDWTRRSGGATGVDPYIRTADEAAMYIGPIRYGDQFGNGRTQPEPREIPTTGTRRSFNDQEPIRTARGDGRNGNTYRGSDSQYNPNSTYGGSQSGYQSSTSGYNSRGTVNSGRNNSGQPAGTGYGQDGYQRPGVSTNGNQEYRPGDYKSGGYQTRTGNNQTGSGGYQPGSRGYQPGADGNKSATGNYQSGSGSYQTGGYNTGGQKTGSYGSGYQSGGRQAGDTRPGAQPNGNSPQGYRPGDYRPGTGYKAGDYRSQDNSRSGTGTGTSSSAVPSPPGFGGSGSGSTSSGSGYPNRSNGGTRGNTGGFQADNRTRSGASQRLPLTNVPAEKTTQDNLAAANPPADSMPITRISTDNVTSDAPKPWGLLAATGIALMASLGGNAYMGYVFYGLHTRYRRLLVKVHRSERIEDRRTRRERRE